MSRNENPQVPERMSKVLDFLKEVVPVLRDSQRKSQVNTHRGGESKSLAQGGVSSKEVWNSVGTVSRKDMRTENPGMSSMWVQVHGPTWLELPKTEKVT